MRKTRVSLLLTLLGLLASGAACSRGPARPDLELRLTLSQEKWHAWESPWYLLQLKNLGRDPVEIKDRAWWVQAHVLINADEKSGLRFQITAPDGHEVRPLSSPWGIHGDMHFWTNDCGEGKSCDLLGYTTYQLKAGETLTATPSMVAPVNETYTFEGPADLRALPEIPKNLSPDKLKELKRRWKEQVENLALMGRPGFKTDSAKALTSVPEGYRILEGYRLSEPGVYRIKAIYDTRYRLVELSAEEEFQNDLRDHPRWQPDQAREYYWPHIEKKWKARSPQELAELRARRAKAEEENTRRIYVESNVVEIEVIPAPPSGLPRPSMAAVREMLNDPNSRRIMDPQRIDGETQ